MTRAACPDCEWEANVPAKVQADRLVERHIMERHNRVPMTVAQRYADHPDVGKTSLVGTIITPEDIAMRDLELEADARRMQEAELDVMGDVADNYDGSPI